MKALLLSKLLVYGTLLNCYFSIFFLLFNVQSGTYKKKEENQELMQYQKHPV